MNWKVEGYKLTINNKEATLSYAKSLDELREVLRDHGASGPDPAYWVYRDIGDPEAPYGQRSDITILAGGTIGEEYVKTHGHYHLGEGVERYKLLSGNAMVLLQKPAFNFEGVEAVRLVRMPLGQLIDIPDGWGHSVINIGPDFAVLENYEPATIDQLYDPYKKLHGSSYYVLEKDGQPSIEPNPNYKDLPKLQSY